MEKDIYLRYNAQFYKKKNSNSKVQKKVINNILNEASKNNLKKRYIINHLRKYSDNRDFIYSLRVYKSKKNVYFLEDDKVFDIVHAFILLIEYKDKLIIFKKSTNTILSSLSDDFELIDYKEVLSIAEDNSHIQRVSLRHMTISGDSIHSSSYETTGNLDGLLSMHSAGRSIPSSVKIKQDSITKSLTASTGRISESSGKYNINELFDWAKKQLEIMKPQTNNPFVRNFAQPIVLTEVLNNSEPQAILIDFHKILDSEDENIIEFALDEQGREKLFNFLKKVHKFANIDNVDNNSSTHTIELKKNKKSLRFISPFLKNITIKEDDKNISLQAYIIDNKLYSIIFNKLEYIYCMGLCFKNMSGKSEMDAILAILEPQSSFNNVSSEKGTITSEHTNFDKDSMFGAVESIHKNDEYIFCDDLGIEWCDHISINIKNKKINFIHSKASSDTSLSASKMHEVVGQGIKNLGNMTFSLDYLKSKKKNKFAENYKRDKVLSKIKRTRKKGFVEKNFNEIEKIINDYGTQRECILSCSFLSKQDIQAKFNEIKNTEETVKGNVYQLFWIISSFIHACRGSNIIPKIYCKK